MLVASCVILLVGFGIRASFGVFQIPIAERVRLAARRVLAGDRHPEPRLGHRPADLRARIAERFGDRRAIVLGALFYALGLVLSAYAVTPGRRTSSSTC